MMSLLFFWYHFHRFAPQMGIGGRRWAFRPTPVSSTASPNPPWAVIRFMLEGRFMHGWWIAWEAWQALHPRWQLISEFNERSVKSNWMKERWARIVAGNPGTNRMKLKKLDWVERDGHWKGVLILHGYCKEGKGIRTRRCSQLWASEEGAAAMKRLPQAFLVPTKNAGEVCTCGGWKLQDCPLIYVATLKRSRCVHVVSFKKEGHQLERTVGLKLFSVKIWIK